MRDLVKRLWKEEEGQDLIEYALLVALIALIVIGAFPPLANAIKNVFNNATAQMNTT